ncbi:MAG TPA: hypothetical protein VI056_05395 [Candidatus Limnocylindria bacterium]
MPSASADAGAAVVQIGARPAHARDAFALGALILAGIVVAWWSGWPWLFTNLLILAGPLLYLVRQPAVRRGIRFEFVLLLVLLAVVAFDSLAERYGGWRAHSLLPRLPAEIAFEEAQWTALYFPLVLAVHRRFFARVVPPVRPAARGLLEGAFFLAIGTALAPFAQPLFVDYVYLKAGLALELPVIALAIALDRRLIGELVRVSAAAAAFVFVYELLALEHGYWSFAGTYIGSLQVGPYVFPFEELLFLVVLSAPAVVSAAFIFNAGPRPWELWHSLVERLPASSAQLSARVADGVLRARVMRARSSSRLP